MNESSFGVHKIEFMINSGEDFSNSSRVRDHANSSHDFSEITTWNNSWRLIIDTAFETSWTPINELDGSLGFDSSNGSVNILWYNITSVHHTTGHVFTVSWITFGHHRGRFESGVSDFSNR
jgi:predicted Zn-dependent protease